MLRADANSGDLVANFPLRWFELAGEIGSKEWRNTRSKHGGKCQPADRIGMTVAVLGSRVA